MPEWKPVKIKTLDEARQMVGYKIRWKTPRYRLDSGNFLSEREGILIFCLSAGCKPVICPEIAAAKPSQCYGLGYGRMGVSQNDRLLVRLERFHARTRDLLVPHYYGPRLSAIIAYCPES